MDVSSVSMNNGLAFLATGIKSENLATGAAMTVMGQIQESQQIMADALIKMIESAPRFDGTGQVIDVAA